jgi:hypothetical protein
MVINTRNRTLIIMLCFFQLVFESIFEEFIYKKMKFFELILIKETVCFNQYQRKITIYLLLCFQYYLEFK